jgi:hypothetical protein
LREDYLKAVDKLTVLSPPQDMVKLSESHQLLLQQMESKNDEIVELKGQVEDIRYQLEDLIRRNIVVTNTTHDGRIISKTDGYNRPLG